MYSAVHTGANSQLGGLNEGLLATAYQPLTPEEVKKAAMPPTSKGMRREINNFI
jgi:hypothetical protein